MNNLIIKTHTKFMEEYLISSFCQASGNVFTLSPSVDSEMTFFHNGYENFTQVITDQKSHTGFSRNTLPFHGNNLCTAKAADEHLILLYTRSTELFYVKEEAIGSGNFMKEYSLPMPLPQDTDKIQSVTVHPLEQGFALGIIAHCKSNDLYYLIYGIWMEKVPTLNQLTNGFIHPTGLFRGNSSDNLSYIIWGDKINEYSFSSERWSSYTLKETITPVQIAFTSMDEQHSCLFACVHAADSYRFVCVELEHTTMTAELTTIDFSDKLIDIQASVYTNPYQSYEKEIHVLALSQNHALYHCRITNNKENSGYLFSTLNDLGYDSIESFSLVKNSSMDFKAYLSPVKHDRLLRITYGSLTSLWMEEDIHILKESYVQPLTGYATELLFQDTKGLPYQDFTVTLWSSDITRVMTAGNFHLLGIDNRITLKTDHVGMITVFQPTSELSSSSLIVSVPSLMPLGQTYVIRQSDTLKDKMSRLTSDDLYHATKSDGSFLLNEKHRTQATAESILKSVKQFTDVTTKMEHVRLTSSLFCCQENEIERTSQIHCNANTIGWKITLDHGNISYSDLSADEVSYHFERLSYDYDNGLLSFFGKIGDFFKKIGNKIVETVVIVGQKIVDAIKVAVEFVVEGARYVYNEIINLVEQALDKALLQLAQSLYLINWSILK